MDEKKFKDVKSIDDILQQLLNRKITINYTQHEEPEMRETSGTLRGVSKDVIWIEMFDAFGRKLNYFMNRHSCTLLSVVEEPS